MAGNAILLNGLLMRFGVSWVGVLRAIHRDNKLIERIFIGVPLGLWIALSGELFFKNDELGEQV